MTQARNITVDDGALLARPLSARSAVASLLLGMRPPRLQGSRLVQWCRLFGIAEGTTRVALSRMHAAGDLQVRDGSYELSGALAVRQRHQDWSLRPSVRAWAGEWSLAVVTGERRAAGERQALRTAMARLRFAERREGVWMRPDNLPPESAPADAHRVVAAQCTWWRARPEDDPVALVAALFDVAGWAARGADLCGRMTETTARLRVGELEALADAFVLGAAALQHVRRDPLLPVELLPAEWPGEALRTAYADYRDAFGTAAATWFRTAAGT